MAQENTENHKKLYIKTWGCQMNVYDSNRMADILAGLGYKPVETPDDADMIILNTCHIREKATDKVFSELGRLRKHKDAKEEQGKKMKYYLLLLKFITQWWYDLEHDIDAK